jgi:hypothetical protein
MDTPIHNYANLALPSSKVVSSELNAIKINTAKSDAASNLPRHKAGERFLKGPIPMAWLNKAMQLPGKSFQVAIIIWYLASMKNNRQVKLTQKELDIFNINRNAKYRALAELKSVNLISLYSENGKNPTVTLLDI